MAIEQSIRTIHDYEQRRGDLRARIATEDLDDGARSSIDTEIFSLNCEIERQARLINEQLRDMAKKKSAPDRALSVPDVGDPDLKAFLIQVKDTVEKLRETQGEKGPGATAEREKLTREREKAQKLKTESTSTKKELTTEQKKLETAQDEIERERARLAKERAKVKHEREHIEHDRDKVQKDKEDVDDRIDQNTKDRDTADRERKDIAKRLKVTKDPKRRFELERRGTELTNKIRVLDQKRQQDVRIRDDQLARMLKAMNRELEQLDEADEHFEKEEAHLDEEEKRLGERQKQLAQAVEATDERLHTIEQAEAQLKSAR